MKANFRSIVLILPLLLSSCVHKTNQAVIQPPLAPPIEDAPLPKPDNAPANLPPPVISLPDKAENQPPPTTPKQQPPPPEPKHRKPNKTTPAPAQTPTPGAQTADEASNAGPGVSAVGNLSSGDPGNVKDQAQSLITETEHGLSGINRKLNDQEAKTSAQIKEFLKEAKVALSTNDVDGARTLAMKAKVLLGELNQ